jgi:hypothetical protein
MSTSPRVVRNFFLRGEVDGVPTPIGTGPKSAGGGFSLEINMRNEGQVTAPVRVVGTENHGKLTLNVIDETGNVVFTHVTSR